MTCILAIETSCDETAAAIIRDGQTIAANIVASQVEMHRKYGGVFPELASRLHVEAISTVVAEALTAAQCTPADLDALAVTRGPGLAGALLVGVNFAKGLALGWQKPLLAINHLEGHLYSLWLTPYAEQIQFPALCLIVSGGHSDLYLMTDHLQYQHLGGTLDDAAGEAFDKVARILGLPYPGGPAIEKAAQSGNPAAYPFKIPVADKPYTFSFSGIKTAVMRAVQPAQTGQRRPPKSERLATELLRPDVNVADAAASFQAVAVEMLVEKTVGAAKDFGAKTILLSGGVSANKLLRARLSEESALPVYYPPMALCTDNAAMIAAAAHQRFLRGQRDPLAFDVLPMWPLA
jgi:N6-L-threonylcarbamoyladenine synthase